MSDECGLHPALATYLRYDITSPETELFCFLCQVLDKYSNLPIAVRVAILRAVSDIQR